MKKIYTLLISSFLVINGFSQISFCDDFESYSIGIAGGDPIAETSPKWNSWDELMNGTTAPFIDDVAVSNQVASSGSNCLYFIGNPGPGPQDILLMFDTTSNITQGTLGMLSTPYVTGEFTFSQMMYVRNGAYLNFQAENTPGVEWSLEVNFDVTGDILMSNTGGTSAAGSFPINQWFEFRFEIDLSNNNWELFIDGVSQGAFSNSVNRIASLDLYTRAGDEYYVDDVCYSYTPASLAAVNGQTYLINPIDGLAGQQRYPSVEVRNFGLNPITEFEITFDYNGSQITENITNINGGLGLASLDVYQVDFTNTITLASGVSTATAWIDADVNNGTTQNTADDTLTIQIEAVEAAAGKMVVGEEATGTWCGWCQRGAVALNWMDKEYAGYWQGIAVHNGDPMADPAYDGALGGYISGYPSGLVDRGAEIDPSEFKQDFLQRIIIPPNVSITNGAELNIAGDSISVSLTVDFLDNQMTNHKLACVLVEDSVTGSGNGWSQSNSYSGGADLIDVDGTNWNTLTSPVPYTLMIYRHVARSIAPSFTGETLPGTYSMGDSETVCFKFYLDPSWDLSQIHIVGMLIDGNGQVDNASSTSINTAVNTGYSSCQTATSSVELNGPDRINVFPNPATKEIYLSNVNEENVLVKIIDIKGAVVLEKQIKDKQYLNINNLSKGTYTILFEGRDINETRTFIKD